MGVDLLVLAITLAAQEEWPLVKGILNIHNTKFVLYNLWPYRCMVAAREGGLTYTAQTGLPYFDSAAVIAIGSWYYSSALESMGAILCFRCRSVNICPSYTQ